MSGREGKERKGEKKKHLQCFMNFSHKCSYGRRKHTGPEAGQECTLANNIWVSTNNIPDIVKIKTP